jgi:hypothetical protein
MAVVRTGILEEHIASIIRVTATIPSSAVLSTLMMELIYSSETSVPRRAMQYHIREYGILH